MASAEGKADMGLLPRVSRFALGVLVVLALTSLPALRFDRIPGCALSPQIAWAGGSPDETLNPKKAPTMQPGFVAPTGSIAVGVSDVQRPGTARIKRWEIYYRVFRIFAQRLI
jgi:hypothetical protein